jgi:hypothetical protein
VNYTAAAEESKISLAWRKQSENRMEVYDKKSGGFFYHDFNPEDHFDEKAYVLARKQ